MSVSSSSSSARTLYSPPTPTPQQRRRCLPLWPCRNHYGDGDARYDMNDDRFYYYYYNHNNEGEVVAPIMSLGLSTRRERLALTLRLLLSFILLTGWNYACNWGLQMCLILMNYSSGSSGGSTNSHNKNHSSVSNETNTEEHYKNDNNDNSYYYYIRGGGNNTDGGDSSTGGGEATSLVMSALDKMWLILSFFGLLFGAWIVITLLRIIWKKRSSRHYWAWRPSAAAAGRDRDDQGAEWTRSTPPSMFFHVSFREVFSMEIQEGGNDTYLPFTNEEIKQFSIRMLVALHVWPMFIIFIFWPCYLRLLHNYSSGKNNVTSSWKLSLSSSFLLLISSYALYNYILLGFQKNLCCPSNNRRRGDIDEHETFFLFPDGEEHEDPTMADLSVGLLTPQRGEDSSIGGGGASASGVADENCDDGDAAGAAGTNSVTRSNSGDAKQKRRGMQDNREDYRHINNL